MPRFLINVWTEWCGMDQTYAAIANDEAELLCLASELAYENFSTFDCFTTLLEDNFPEVEDGEYTDEMQEEMAEIEGEYYGSDIEPWDETRPEEEWDWYELVYDNTK